MSSPQSLNEWLLLALGVWSVLFLTGVGIRACDALFQFWKKK